MQGAIINRINTNGILKTKNNHFLKAGSAMCCGTSSIRSFFSSSSSTKTIPAFESFIKVVPGLSIDQNPGHHSKTSSTAAMLS